MTTPCVAPVQRVQPGILSPDDVILQITGMTCASCVRRVEKATLKVPGIVDASVNLATERARIRYANGAVPDATLLLEAVRGAGYDAHVVADQVQHTVVEQGPPKPQPRFLEGRTRARLFHGPASVSLRIPS